MFPTVRAQVEATITRHVGAALVKQALQQPNVVQRSNLLALVKLLFTDTGVSNYYMVFWPWRLPSQYDGQDLTVQAFSINHANGAPNMYWPAQANAIANVDVSRARRYATPWTFAKGDWRQNIGAILTLPDTPGTTNVVTASDMAARYIGTPWAHPAITGGTLSIVTGGIGGASYLNTYASFNGIFTGASVGNGGPPADSNAYVRILDGVDAGVYRIRFIDTVNRRMYLSNLDGSNFVATGGNQNGLRAVFYYRTAAYFNEEGVIAASQGTVSFGGSFDPGTSRASYIFRLHYEKSGSPNPSGGAHLKGSYWFAIRPWIFGTGTDVATSPSNTDLATIASSLLPIYRAHLFPAPSAGLLGGGCGVALDVANQRLWFAVDDGTNSAVAWWLYKSPECGHEVATNSGTPNSPIAGITMTGARARALEMGSDDTVYVALGGGANAGVVKITNGLVATQWLTSSAGLGAALNGLKVDTSRRRTGGAATASTNGANRITATDGAFTQADVGRAIALTGLGADNGTYKISAYVDATHVDVTTLAGGAVTFTNQAGGQFQIGDRIYLFWNDTTSWAGSGNGFISIRYMESLAFGTILTTGDLAVTTSTGRTLYDGHATAKGNKPAAAIDPATGNLYWSSSDTAARVNRFDVTSRTVSQKTVASFTNPADGSALTNPAVVYGIGVNPHSAFREVWLGTDQGIIRFSPDHADLSTLTTGAYVAALPANQYRRYYGSGVNTVYTQPANYSRPSGETMNPNTRAYTGFTFGPDGKAYATVLFTSYTEITRYLREQDLFVCADTPVGRSSNTIGPNLQAAHMALPNGEVLLLQMTSSASAPSIYVASALVDYQWIGGAWVAQEAVRGPIPDATSQPGLLAKDLHTAMEDLLYGVKVAFATGAGGDAVQYIGRMNQKQAQQADGAWAAGTASNWLGSNFTAADVGRYLRVESGTQQGVYLVTGYVNANTLTVQTAGRAAYNAGAEAGPLNYTLWDHGATTAGAETCTVLAANGIGADNAQDVTNISAEMFYMRTALAVDAEAIKVAMGPIPPAGSAALLAYLDSYPAAANNISPGIPSGLALSGTTINPPEAVLDYAAGRYGHDNTNGRLNLPVPANVGGVDVQSVLTGHAVTVDLGAEVEIGAVIVRMRYGTADPAAHLHTETQNTGGTIANLHKASTTAPVASTSVTHRRSTLTGATGLGLPRAVPPTATLSTGDFLAAGSVTYNDGATTQGGNTLGSALGRFTGTAGGVVQLTSGGDVGYYRITAVSGDGATATVRNLAQTAKAWGASATGLDFVIYANAAREDDILISGGTFKTTIEMLTSPTTARVRTYHSAALTNAAWEVLTPTWSLVKRLSPQVSALPPEVVNNRTYLSTDGRDLDASTTEDGTVKYVFDLTDLATAQRTGRWWKFSTSGRFATHSNSNTTTPSLAGIEVYDTAGKRLLAGPNGQVDTVESEPNFLACHVTRLDWIQALYAASAVVPGVNALASLGGAQGDTVTLAGGAAFRGLKIGPPGTTLTVDASGYVNLGGADRPFTAADVGRIIWIQAGPNQGYYRIVTVASGTQVTSVVRVSGTAVTLAVDATPRAWSLHEGILAGTATYDFLYLDGYGEFTIKAVSDDLLTITLNETTYATAANLQWEIRRRAIPAGTVGVAAGVDATKVARLVYSTIEQPRQPGDVMQDHRGGLAFHATDIGTPIQRADGSIAGGSGAFTGTAFTADDVGRLLLITTGANKGPYRISAFTSATAITLVNVRTGAAVSLAADAGPVTYKVWGEKRFRASRYATVLRQ